MNSVHGRVDVVFALQDVGEKLKRGLVKINVFTQIIELCYI